LFQIVDALQEFFDEFRIDGVGADIGLGNGMQRAADQDRQPEQDQNEPWVSVFGWQGVHRFQFQWK
jgi:hypothetical protein